MNYETKGREREREREEERRERERLKDANFVFQRRDERVGGSYGVRSLETAFGSILGTARTESTVPPTEPKHQNRHRFPINYIVESITIYHSLNTRIHMCVWKRGSLSTVHKIAVVKKTIIRRERYSLCQTFCRSLRLHVILISLCKFTHVVSSNAICVRGCSILFEAN